MLLITPYYFVLPDALREEMEQQQSQELEENNRAHSQQMMAARMELERAMELSKQKVKFETYCLKGRRLRFVG